MQYVQCRVLTLYCTGFLWTALSLPVAQGQTVTATVSAGTYPFSIAVNPVTNKTYVANANSNNVTVIERPTNSTLTLSVGTGPIGVAVDPVANKIYVSNYGSNNVTVIDGAINSVATATGISDVASGFAFTPLLFSPGFTSVKLADHTGDGKADVTVYNKTTASAYFGTGNGDGTFAFQSPFWSPGYDTVVPQDLNGDGKADIILYNSVTGTEYPGSVTATAPLPIHTRCGDRVRCSRDEAKNYVEYLSSSPDVLLPAGCERTDSYGHTGRGNRP